jgi:hypothetical protein
MEKRPMFATIVFKDCASLSKYQVFTSGLPNEYRLFSKIACFDEFLDTICF